MTRVLTIVTKKNSEKHCVVVTKGFFNFLKKENINLLSSEILNPNQARDFFFEKLALRQEKKITSFFNNQQIDSCWQDNYARKKKVFFSDMDSTVIENETFNDLGKILGIKNQINKITQLGIEGKIDFLTSLKKRVLLLKNLKANPPLKLLEKKISYTEGVFSLIKTLKQQKVKTFLITGGFNPISQYVANEIGFDEVFANTYEIKKNRFTGNMLEPIILPQEKLEIVKEKLKELNLSPHQAAAVGDGMNDVEMLSLAGLGVAYYGVEKLKEKIPRQINFTDLTSLLYFQGYKNDEII